MGAASVSIRWPWAAREARSALMVARAPAASFRSLARPARAWRWPSMADRAVLVLPLLAASSIALSICPRRRSRSATLWAATAEALAPNKDSRHGAATRASMGLYDHER